jgi:4-amino-4-deoxy-L-arabinose transferase-like glycosyltransferase
LRSTLLRLWLLIVAAALFINLGAYPLYDADEGRNGEVGREMAATNDYVMPRIDGMPYLDKPIVYFAAEAMCMEVLGPTELAARLPAYLFTLFTAALIFWFARRVWGEDEALIAAIAYLAMPLTLAFSRTVIFDSALSFFMVLSTIAFYFAVEDRRPRLSGAELDRRGRLSSTGWTAIAWASIALGVLTKGPVAIAVPLLIAIPYAIKRKAFRALWSWLGLVLFVVIIAPWVWAVSRVVPDFLHYVLVTETAQRLATKALKRTGPPWYFIPFVIGGALPWCIPAGMSLRRAHREDATFFAVLWVLVPFLFFSISQSKRPQYILPVMPAIALLAARYWTTEERGARIASRVAAIVFLVFGTVLLAAPHVHIKMDPETAVGAKAAAIPMAIGTLLGALAFIKRRDLALIAMSIPIITIPLTAKPLLDAIGERRSAKSFVAQLPASPKYVAIEDYTGSMQFYLRKPIDVVTPDAEEFTSNYIIRHYDQFAKDARWPVRRSLTLEHGVVYIVRNNDAAHRAMLEKKGFSLVATGAHHVAYK